MKRGDIFKHVVNNTEYIILSIAKFKNNQTRKWESCVIYFQSPETKQGTYQIEDMYVREERDFKKRFKKFETKS